MKKLLAFALALLCVLPLLASCGGSEQNVRGSNKIYYIKEDKHGRRSLAFEYSDEINGATTGARVGQIIAAIKQPRTAGALPALPQVIEVKDLKIRGSTLEIDYGETYGFLGKAEKVLAAAAVALSVIDDGDIEYVVIKSGGEAQPPVYDGYLFDGKFVLDELMY